MKATFLLVTALFTSAAIPLMADVATFSSSNSQLCIGAAGCGASTQTIGGGSGITVTFNPIANATVNTPFEHSLGEIQIACVGGGTGCGPQSLAGLVLFLNISQTIPTAGNGSITGGVFSGVVSGTSSTALVTWMMPSATTIGPISYTLANSVLSLSAPSQNGGLTEVRACITSTGETCTAPVTAMPEPSAWVTCCTGAAFLGLAHMRRRRLRKKS